MGNDSRSFLTSPCRAGEHLVSLGQAGEGDTELAAVARVREASKSAQETLLVGRYSVMCCGTCTVLWHLYCDVVPVIYCGTCTVVRYMYCAVVHAF